MPVLPRRAFGVGVAVHSFPIRAGIAQPAPNRLTDSSLAHWGRPNSVLYRVLHQILATQCTLCARTDYTMAGISASGVLLGSSGLICNQRVGGSSPSAGSRLFNQRSIRNCVIPEDRSLTVAALMSRAGERAVWRYAKELLKATLPARSPDVRSRRRSLPRPSHLRSAGCSIFSDLARCTGMPDAHICFAQ